MYFRFANAFIKADGKVTSHEIEGLETLKNLFYPTYDVVNETPVDVPLFENKVEDKPLSLDELLTELNNLVGLDDVKRDVQEMVNFLKIQKLRASKGVSFFRTR